MAYLQLADAPIEQYYIRVPQQDGSVKMVREDLFDQLDPYTWEQTMEMLSPYNEFGMSGIKDWIARHREKKDARQQRKQLKSESKAQGRVLRAQGGGALGKILNTATNIFGGQQQPPAPGDPRMDIAYSQDQGLTVQPSKQWYENPIVIGGGLLLLIGGGYMLLKNKK